LSSDHWHAAVSGRAGGIAVLKIAGGPFSLKINRGVLRYITTSSVHYVPRKFIDFQAHPANTPARASQLLRNDVD